VIGLVPLQVPVEALNDWPTCAVPETAGITVADGATTVVFATVTCTVDDADRPNRSYATAFRLCPAFVKELVSSFPVSLNAKGAVLSVYFNVPSMRNATRLTLPDVETAQVTVPDRVAPADGDDVAIVSCDVAVA
jgi:hypothetical protein